MKFDLNSLNKYFTTQGMADINKLLEEMPLRAGYGVIIAGAVAWLFAGMAVFYATTIAQDVASIRAELVKSEALKPEVPQLVTTPVAVDEIKSFIEKVNPMYKDINISIKGNNLVMNANSGRYFGAFREAINHAYNGGQGWRLSLQSLCVGRECKDKGFLAGEFKVNRLKVVR